MRDESSAVITSYFAHIPVQFYEVQLSQVSDYVQQMSKPRKSQAGKGMELVNIKAST